jgi:drug/metabolite transporter (DMT)-like permease
MKDGSTSSTNENARGEGITSRTTWLCYGACALAGCLWGTGFYFGRLALDEMAVEWMVLYRFLFAALGMLPVIVLHRGARLRLTRAELRILLICSALGVPLQFLLQFHGLARTTVSHA